MGIKQTDIMSFLEPESKGFLYDTARAFLKRHSNPELLLGQLKNLASQGEFESCSDLIELLFEEKHPLTDSVDICLLKAEILFQQNSDLSTSFDWVKQAQLIDKKNPIVTSWVTLLESTEQVKDGDSQKGLSKLSQLIDDNKLQALAKYTIAYHLFWKNAHCEQSILMLQDVVLQKPHFIKAWACLGFAYAKVGDKQRAQEAFGTCLKYEKNPKMINFYKQKLSA